MSGSGNERLSIHNQLEEYEDRKKRWILDIEKTPCARDALLHGILGGIALGLVYFANWGWAKKQFTQARLRLVRRSCNLAVGGFALVSLGSWEYCRYQKAKHRLEVKRTVNVLNKLNKMSAGGGATTWQPEDNVNTKPETSKPPS